MPRIAVRFSNIFKAAGNKVTDNLDVDAFKARATKTFRDKPYLAEYTNRLNDALNDPRYHSTIQPYAKDIINLKYSKVKRAYLNLDAEVKANDFTDSLSIKGQTDKETLTNARVFIKQSLRHLEHSYKQGFRLYEQDILNNFKAEGLEAMQAFKIMLKAPAKFEKLYGATAETVAVNLYDGNINSGNKIVDSMVKALKKSDDTLLTNLQAEGTLIGKAKRHFLPFHISPDAVALLGKEKATELITKTTKLTDKGAENLINLIADTDTPIGLNKLSALLQESLVKFRSGAHMLEFFKELNPNDFSLNLFNEYFGHKQRILRLAHMQMIYGEHPNEALNRALQRARRNLGKSMSKDLDKSYKSVLHDFNVRLDLMSGKVFMSDTAVNNISTSFNRALSLVTAAPSRSTVRNLFIDYEGNAQAIGKTLTNTNTHIGSSAKRLYKSMAYLAGHALRGKQHRKAVDEILNVAGWANSLDGMVQGNVMSFEDVFDANRSFSGAANITGYIDDKMRQAQDSLFKWSGNHSLIDFVRARRFVSLQQLFTNVFKQTSYKAWRDSLNPLELKQLDTLATNFGLDENVFNFFKEAKKYRPSFDSDITRKLGFANMPEYISKQSILDTSDDIVNKFKRSSETAKAFKERVAGNWQKFIYNSTSSHAPVTTVADSLTGPMFANSPAWVTMTIRPFTKFADVANAQAQTFIEDLATAIYGRPNKFIGFDRSLIAYGQAFGVYLAYTAAHIWAKDLMNNRAPTNFTEPTNAIRLAALSGFGGYANMVAGNLGGVFPSNSNSLYASTPLGSAFYDAKHLTKALSSKKNRAALTARALHQANPFTQLWYASGAIEYAINHVLFEPTQLKARYRNLERYGKPYLF